MMPKVLGPLTRRRWGVLPILAVAVTLLALDGVLVLPHADGNVNQWTARLTLDKFLIDHSDFTVL